MYTTPESDTDVVDRIATLLGTQSEWNADQLESIADLIGAVRPHPGDSAPTYRDDFLAATGRPVVAYYVGDEDGRDIITCGKCGTEYNAATHDDECPHVQVTR